MDKFRIDSHKLIYHVGRVNDWLNGKEIYPIYLEIAPSGACNQRCTFCALDYLAYKPVYLDTRLLKARLYEMALLGVRSIMYAGEGEPLLHKDIADIVNYTKKVGIDVAITTNGVFLKEELLDMILNNVTWIKVSINAATRKTYSQIHRTNSGDFDKVIKNMAYAAKVRKNRGYNCTLGMQIILLPENAHEILRLTKMAKDMGIDYLVVKPYSQHPFSKTTKYKDIKYNKYLRIADDLKKFNDKKFNVIFRIRTMKKWDKPDRDYRHCLALPFWSYIDARGNLWGCSAYLGDKRFCYGNIYKKTFKEICESKNRLNSIRWVEEKLRIVKCRINCRMDEINRYLWELKHPPEHVNFI